MNLKITHNTPTGRRLQHFNTPVTTKHGTSPLPIPQNSQTQESRFFDRACSLLDVLDGLTIDKVVLEGALMPIALDIFTPDAAPLKVNFFIEWTTRTGLLEVV
jgi:hypothetical protein